LLVEHFENMANEKTALVELEGLITAAQGLLQEISHLSNRRNCSCGSDRITFNIARHICNTYITVEQLILLSHIRLLYHQYRELSTAVRPPFSPHLSWSDRVSITAPS
jgi:hypothetical protein